MLHILVEVFGGIGLFFVAINLLSDSIKKLGSGYTPGILRTFSKNDLTSTLGGLVSGIATSSGKAVTFSLVPLAELGQLNLRKCLPVVMGGSVGSAFIVLWASVDFKLFVFILMGIAGALTQFGNQKDEKLKLITHVILGFALLFYGLELIKMGAAPVKELPWFNEYMEASQGRWFFALLVGAGLAFLSQSGSSVAIIAMSLVNSGLLGFDEAVMVVFGTNVGSGISTAMLGLTMSGIGRELVLFHAFFKVIGVFVLVPLFAFEVYGEVGLIKEFVQHLSHTASMQIAMIYLLYEIITGIAIAGFLTPIARGIESVSAGISMPRFDELDYGFDDKEYKAYIALAYADGADVKSLVQELENHDIKVLVAKRYDSDWISLMRESRAEALLVDLQGHLEQHFSEIEEMMEEVTVPVFFNEHAESPDSSEVRSLSKQLLNKMVSHRRRREAAAEFTM